jgi:hypothetical protein
VQKKLIGKSRRNLLLYKQTLGELTQTELEAAVGLLLGVFFFSLQTQNKAKTYRLKLGQSEKHYTYLMYLCEQVFSR